jgi:hypothetical protein
MLSQSLSRIFVNQRAAVSPLPHGEQERRRAIRVDAPFPATLRGVDRSGERFTLAVVLDSLSACGLYLRLARPVEIGATVFVVVRLSTAPAEVASGPRVAFRGMVRRAEQRSDGWYGLAVEFTRHHAGLAQRFARPPGARSTQSLTVCSSRSRSRTSVTIRPVSPLERPRSPNVPAARARSEQRHYARERRVTRRQQTEQQRTHCRAAPHVPPDAATQPGRWRKRRPGLPLIGHAGSRRASHETGLRSNRSSVRLFYFTKEGTQ